MAVHAQNILYVEVDLTYVKAPLLIPVSAEEVDDRGLMRCVGYRELAEADFAVTLDGVIVKHRYGREGGRISPATMRRLFAVRIRGGFATRRRIQWARFYVVLVRRALSRDWWQVLRDSASSDFIAHEHQRHCPHRLEWRTFYPGHRWQSCSACAKPLDHTGGDSGKVG